MNAIIQTTVSPVNNAVATTSPYARPVAASKRARWDLDQDVLRGRSLDARFKFLPDGLSLIGEISFLTDVERRFVSQIQGRTYANVFGLVERFINAKVLEVSQHHFLGDQIALEALVRFSAEELKHQEMFRRIDKLAEQVMPEGYRFLPDPDDVAKVVLGKSTWAVLALTLHIELFTQAHYKSSIEPDEQLSPLYKDVFKYHWKEESQHAVIDELEWAVEDAKLSEKQRDQAVSEFIELVGAVDGILQLQSAADAEYFVQNAGRPLSQAKRDKLREAFLAAYRYQYIVSGVTQTRFVEVLGRFINETHNARIQAALAPLL